MATKQTRRALSVSGALYDALQLRAVQEGITRSGLVEREMRKLLGMPALNASFVRPTVTTSAKKKLAEKKEIENIEPLFGDLLVQPTYSARL